MHEPVDLLRTAEEDAAQHQTEHALRMGFSVGERQRGPPGAAENQPSLDAQMHAQRSRSATRCGVVLSASSPSGVDCPAPR